MEITLKEIKLKDKLILQNLMQLYLHNLSAYFPIEFDSQSGLYVYDNLDNYFNSSIYKAYFILDDKNLVGFILTNLLEEKNIIQEMFILNNYKRQGYGKIVVFKVWDKFKGNWEIKVVPCSLSAEKFWLNVVKEYTKDNFQVEYVGKYNRAVLTFNNF